MSEPSPAHISRPLEIDKIESLPTDAGEVELKLGGRWAEPDRVLGEDQELLVVSVHGQRHRFPVRRVARDAEQPEPGRWNATFVVPGWAVPHEPGQAALWLGSAVIPIPPVRGPKQELQRTADAAQIRTVLAGAQSELAAQAARHGELEQTLAALRDELEQLRAGVADQRRELHERASESAALRERIGAADAAAEHRVAETAGLRDELAAADASREAALSESAGLRSELERIATELAAMREQVRNQAGNLGQASRLLADARALAEELRSADAAS